MTRGDQLQLELELRQLPGVMVVGFAERDGAVVIELGVDDDTDRAALRTEASRMAATALDGAVVVEVKAPSGTESPERPSGSRLRVQLLGVTATPGGQRVEVHLAHRGRRVSIGCRPGDGMSMAGAVIDGLGELGLAVPFEPSAVHLLPDDIGSGVLVMLRHRRLDALRRGVAGGRWLEETVARAVLNALNRHLQGDAPAGQPADDEPMVDLRHG